MNLYRVGVRWSNHAIALQPGVYELSDDEAAEVARDCPGQVEPLPAESVARLYSVLADLGIASASFRPHLPDHGGRGRGPAEVMTSASMPALTRPKGR